MPATHERKVTSKTAMPLSAIMTGSAEQLEKQAPTRETAIDLVKKLEASGEAYDANDLLYAFESSADYDPAPKLNEITKPMLTINFADDLINPPELLHLPTASNYTGVMLPAGSASYGHMTLAHPAVWASALGSFLQRFPQPQVLGSQGKTVFDPDFDIDDTGLPHEKPSLPTN